MGLEEPVGSSKLNVVPLLRVVGKEGGNNIIPINVPATVGEIMTSAEDHKKTPLESMLVGYSGYLNTLYPQNGNPRTLEEKIIVLEKIVGICRYRCNSDKERVNYLEFEYLCDNHLMRGEDQSSFSV